MPEGFKFASQFMRRVGGRAVRAQGFVIAGILALSLAASPAQAQLSASPITIIAPTTAGGVIDLIARLTAEEMSKTLGTPVVVENRPGAGGVIGADIVAKAKPDGHTLCFCFSGPISLLGSQQELPYDPAADLVPIRRVYDSYWFFAVRGDSPYQTFEELMADAKARPGLVKYASTAGVGTAVHLSGEMFEKASGLDMVHVAYPGSAQALVDVLNGTVEVGLFSPQFSQQYVEEGQLRLLASVRSERSAAYPDIPTVSEFGFPDYAAGSWTGLFAPAGTPEVVLTQLFDAIELALKSPRVSEEIGQWLDAVPEESSADFKKFIAAETAKWAEISAGIQ